MEPILVRKAQLEDIPEMVALLQQLFSIEEDFEFNYARQEKGLFLLLGEEKNAYIIVAEVSGKIVGMLSAQKNISTAEGGIAATLEDMIVDKSYRRKGIGRKLMEQMLIWAQEKDINRLQLLADNTNSQALTYYQGLDWKFTKMICLRKNLE